MSKLLENYQARRPIIPILMRERQEGSKCKFKVSPGYIGRSCLKEKEGKGKKGRQTDRQTFAFLSYLE